MLFYLKSLNYERWRKKAIEELLNSELEQIEGGACQCDTGAGQIVFTVPDKTKDDGIRQA